MNRTKHYLCLCCVLCECIADTSAHDVAESKKETADEHAAISPELSPKSDKEFFGKDYVWDKRPKVDILHFQHPYPMVQDSDDFDKDFIKDENSDNGSWKAQSEYDRLRHKLAKQKEDLSKAQRATDNAEKDLKAVMERARAAAEAARQASQNSADKAAKPTPKHQHEAPANKPKKGKKESKAIPDPVPIAAPGDVESAASDTEKAMGALEECKKQLAEARKHLKSKTKELEAAKKEQKETQAAWEEARARSKGDEEASENTKNAVKSDYQQYMDARAEYLQQQAAVAKMEVDIKVAAEKVRAIRDGADAGGGVYNTRPKSAAPFLAFPSLVACAVMMLACVA